MRAPCSWWILARSADFSRIQAISGVRNQRVASYHCCFNAQLARIDAGARDAQGFIQLFDRVEMTR